MARSNGDREATENITRCLCVEQEHIDTEQQPPSTGDKRRERKREREREREREGERKRRKRNKARRMRRERDGARKAGGLPKGTQCVRRRSSTLGVARAVPSQRGGV